MILLLFRISDCLNRIGVLSNQLNENEEILNYIEDSIVMMSFIVELEKEFSIEFPDEYLQPGRFLTFGNLCEVINKLRNVE